jgi:hypothetical protein
MRASTRWNHPVVHDAPKPMCQNPNQINPCQANLCKANLRHAKSLASRCSEPKPTANPVRFEAKALDPRDAPSFSFRIRRQQIHFTRRKAIAFRLPSQGERAKTWHAKGKMRFQG